MSEHKCPLCGKDTVSDEMFCRNCQEIAENSHPSRFSSSSQEIQSNGKEVNIPKEIIDEVTQEKVHLNEVINEKIAQEGKKENKRTKIIALTVTGMLLILIAAGAYIYIEERKADKTEVTFWSACVETNTPASYADYLNKYPNGLYIHDAEQHIKELRKREQGEWVQLKKLNNLDKYAAFLIDHPHSPYSSDIKQSMDSLLWANASTENTADSYKVYLENVQIGTISGEYQLQALEKYNYLSQLKTLDGKELADIKVIVSHFYQALSSLKDKEVKKMLVPHLSTFYTMSNISADSLTTILKNQMKENKIKNVIFTPVTDSLTAIVDNKNKVFISVPVSRQVIYSNKKKETSLQQTNMEMGNKFLISNVELVNSKK